MIICKRNILQRSNLALKDVLGGAFSGRELLLFSLESVRDALKIGKDTENLPNFSPTKTEVAIVGPPHTLSIT